MPASRPPEHGPEKRPRCEVAVLPAWIVSTGSARLVNGGREMQKNACRTRLVWTKSRGMAKTTTIEWTEATWNPVTGCDRSTGCRRPRST